MPEQKGGLSFGHAQGHPSTSIPWTDEGTNHEESNILPTTSAVGIPSPSLNPSHFPAFMLPSISGRKQSRALPVPCSSWQAVFGARRQQECHSRREKREHSTADRPQDAAPHLPSRESKLFCLWDTSSFSRPCLGSGLFRGAAFSCIGVALQGDTRQPPRKGEEGSGAVNLSPSIPACTETSESAAQGQREYFCYFSSHVERKKKKSHFSARDSPALTTEQPNCCSSLG